MNVTIKINCDNAAFEEDPSEELSRLLKDQAMQMVMFGLKDRIISDINGNTVGSIEITEE